jgi:hypothetical protein
MNGGLAHHLKMDARGTEAKAGVIGRDLEDMYVSP